MADTTGTIGAIIALIVGVSAAVLVLIFVGGLGGQTFNIVEPQIKEIGNKTVIAETSTTYYNRFVSLAHSDIVPGSLKIWNTTNKKVLGLANFTIIYPNGAFKLINKSKGWNNSGITVNYSYGNADNTLRASVQSGIKGSFDALEQTGSYMPIIILAVIIVLILGLIIGGLAFRTGGGMGGSL